MFGWLTGSRRKLTQSPATPQELQFLDQALWQARYLNNSLRDKLVRWCRVFIQEKHWEGCNGFQLSTESQWAVAAGAGLMVLAKDDWYYEKTKTVLVYPAPYIAKEKALTSLLETSIPAIMGGEYSRAGQTVYRGPVIVNWQDSYAASQSENDGDHLVIHEFSHQLDLINGPQADGLPPLPDQVDPELWRRSFMGEFNAARSMVQQGYRILMDDYGLTQESEFFAVGSEYYFQRPKLLAEFHPQLFQLLNEFYELDLRELLPQEHE